MEENEDYFPESHVWEISPYCVMKTSTVRECVLNGSSSSSSSGVEVMCSDSVRLVSGSSLCSGLVQIWNQSWTWVCEGDLDQRGAEVLCRELDCGAPSLLQGALSPLEQTFHCEGHESALMDCPRSGSRTCSSGAAVNLTCSEPLRLVGGASRCTGTVEVKHRGEWRRMEGMDWDLGATAVLCRDLDCGSAVYGKERYDFRLEPVWSIISHCVKAMSSVRECIQKPQIDSYPYSVEVMCSDSVRLVSGSSLCSGLVQIWNQSWTWVCEGDLDQRGEEVLCRELDCGAPSLLQGALSPLEQTFHCEGNESALMDCPRSGSRTCSSGAAVNLTCSEPLRLVGGASRCTGTVEVKHRGEWRRLGGEDWDLGATAVLCRDLDCGSAVYGEGRDDFSFGYLWSTSPPCVKWMSSVRECVKSADLSRSFYGVEVMCSDFLKSPFISVSVSDGASEARPQGLRVQLGSKFTVACSVEPQYPGGSFRLLSPTEDPAQNHTLPAVNHSAHFLFSDTGHAHKGNYTCVYLLHMFNHSFTFQSHTLQLSVGVSDLDLIIRVLIILLLKLMYILPLYYYYCKLWPARSQEPIVQNRVRQHATQKRHTGGTGGTDMCSGVRHVSSIVLVLTKPTLSLRKDVDAVNAEVWSGFWGMSGGSNTRSFGLLTTSLRRPERDFNV
ncbi:scavenger receptor cysteine-rich type 1 protein M130-like [Boleophthalmus pectinirostris]|uniref:scavenger receptor cysteine-rich type 1 protein M130-like n=1 Tax=Boleophthalmus pectinirostris TaxID=150288 RepID=UPI002430CB4B|nr:scavenger receptor cysteine-rich type 1 protein M130-like [Boleophthalmus pectinirostris]